ncbi:MAG: NUDIX domain-containing protein [Rhizobiales bacterium]|nr:NUDIX domain-containing protein [Hyphomicrobiales bacterium]
MSAGLLPTRFRRKAVIYATWAGRLLVFTEPDHPEAGTQVPGGTIVDGETVADGARREFSEETGFEAPAALTLLGEATYVYEAAGIRHEHARSYVHMRLDGDYPERWEWTERFPDGGEGPIRMAFFFMPLGAVPELFGGLGSFLPAVPALVAAEGGR